MKEIYKDKFVTYQYDKENKLFVETWQLETEHLSNTEFEDILHILVKLYDKYPPKLMLCNYQNLLYAISPQYQEWIKNHVASKAIKNGLIRKANVVAAEYVTQLGVEQMMEEALSEMVFDNRYFATYKEAEKWLLS